MKFLPIKIADKSKLLRLTTSVILLLGAIEPFAFPLVANAAAATGYIRLERVAANTATGGAVCFNPTTNETTVRQMQITFSVTGTPGTADATHYGVNQTAGNWAWDTTAANIPAGTSAFPGTATTSTVSNGVVTFIATTDQSLNTGTTYCLHFGSAALTTPTSAGNNFTGSITLRNNGGTLLTNETVNYASSIISNDQIVVTGTVPSTFTMSLSSNTATFSSNIPTSSSPATTPAITLTVSTNAQNGWTAWAKNTNTKSSLISTSTTDGICFGGNYPTCTGAAWQATSANVHSLSGAAGYGLNVTAGTGTPTVAAEYAGSSTTYGSLDNSQFEKIVSHSVPANADTATLQFGAEASATNKAATDYTDTVTITAAGQF